MIDCRDGKVLHRLTPPEGRQFNGHGCFSADGAILYTSEVVARGSAGRIGLWDVARGYVRAGEWDSGGIGPHEIRRLAGTDRLIVANGGIETDPDDRTMLNVGTMRPNLALIEAGRILERAELAADPGYVQQVLADGAARARSVARKVLQRARAASGLE